MLDPGNLPPLARGAILLLVFVAVAATVLTVITITNRRGAVRRRVEERLIPAMGAGVSLRATDAGQAWVRFVNAIEARGLSLADTKDAKLRAKMVAAGFSHPIAPKLFTFVRLALTLSLPVAFVIFSYAWSGTPPSILKLWFAGSILALMGLYLPNLFIRIRIEQRRRKILNAFPDALDLMLVCVEAGLGLEAAFDRVGNEMMRPHPLLSELLAGVVLEMRAGRSREDALRRMADAAEMDEVRAFTTLLIQSSMLGSSIGQTLRVYAAEMREQRRLRAEEKAHRLPVLLSIPLVACMLPTMIGVLMLPAVIRVIRQLLPAMGGGG